jgi:hypothetical protein
MCVTTETTQEELHLLIDHGVIGHAADKVGFLIDIWQLAVEQQVAGFQVVAVGGQLLNRVATVQQLAFVTVDVSNR